MAFKFNCSKCNQEVVVKFLKPGEVAKCRHCHGEIIVPLTATETGEKASIEIHHDASSPPDIIPENIVSRAELISTHKAIIIGLITGFVFLLIGFSSFFALYLLEQADNLRDNIIYQFLFRAGSTTCGLGYFVSLIYDELLNIDNSILLISSFIFLQELCAIIIGYLLALLSAKSRQLNTMGFALRVAIILLIVGTLSFMLFMPNI